MIKQRALLTSVVCTALTLAFPAVSNAQDDEGFFANFWDKMSYSHFGRPDFAFRTTSYQNPNNQTTNFFQDETVFRQAYVPPCLTPGNLLQPGNCQTTQGNDWDTPIPGESANIRRGDFVPSLDKDFNLMRFRYQGRFEFRFTDSFRFVAAPRAIYDPGRYREFDSASVANLQDGIDPGRAPATLYRGTPNYFEALGVNGKNINPLEFAGENYMLDFPSAIFEWKGGGNTIRVGNQQIAWGQSIFFRTLDVPNGLDFRRHFLLDRALEEFSDKRVPQLSARGTTTIAGVNVDAFVAKFQPNIYPNPNTPYNPIPAQFNIKDRYFTGGYDDELNYGIRLKGDYGTWGWQAIAVSRMNPSGVFRWATSDVERGLFGTLGDTVETAYNAKVPEDSPGCPSYDPATCRKFANVEEALAHAPFSAQPGGVYHAEEWFKYSADARVDAVKTLNNAVSDFPASRDLYATTVNSVPEAKNLLDTFFQGSGGSLRGWLTRDYFREEVFGIGGSYVTTSDIDFLDQLIFNLEIQYTPERRFLFSDAGLGAQPTVKDEYIVSLVVDKWHRFSQDFPGAYMVTQFQHRSESDLVNRSLRGYGGTRDEPAEGIDSANYFVFGFMQPWPNRLYVLEFAMLYDLKGGLLAQPLLKWNPGSGMGMEIYYNFVDGGLHGRRSENVVSSFEWAEEAAIRFRYQF